MKQSISPQLKQYRQQIADIIHAVRAEERRLKQRFPLLRFQNALSVGILLFALSGMLLSAFLYVSGIAPVWVCIISAALFASLSHELEHDLIHQLYFRRQPVIYHAMMLLVWVMRPNTISPWARKKLHLRHHKLSGTQGDIEERLVGNGIANPLLRLLVMFDGLLGLIAQRRILQREIPDYSFWQIMGSAFPLATLYFALWHSFLVLMVAELLYLDVSLYAPWFTELRSLLIDVVVIIIAPNVLRSACLNIMTSYSHYYGGVNNLLQQTQILKHWLFWPIQLFCFNFGSTHGIHHFVVGQPFYLRQLVAPVAHAVMQNCGVRCNDFASFKRANAYTP